MTGNSTLLFIIDRGVEDGELIHIDDLLDPFGKGKQELDKIFKNVVYTPPQEIIAKILLNA